MQFDTASQNDFFTGKCNMGTFGYTAVVTMSYDLDTTHDNNINTEVKDLLTNYGWHFDCPETTIKENGVDRVERNTDLPSTTAWKVDTTPEEAIADFKTALTVYNTNHIGDVPAKMARGHAFAITNNRYDCIWVK